MSVYSWRVVLLLKAGSIPNATESGNEKLNAAAAAAK